MAGGKISNQTLNSMKIIKNSYQVIGADGEKENKKKL